MPKIMEKISGGNKLMSFLCFVENIFISDKVMKINQYEWAQSRALLITNNNVHNLKKEEIKRSIPLKDIVGVSVTTEAEGDEFVIHVLEDYDYRFICEK
jgi:hypothetical protein